MLLMRSCPPPTIERPRCAKAPNATHQWTALWCSKMQFYVVSHCNLSLYSTSQICMQCLTDLIIFLVAVESIFKNPHSALLYRYFRQSLESKYLAFQFLPRCRIHNLWTPHCSMLWFLPKTIVPLFVIWATLDCKSSSMIGRLQWMWAWSGLLHRRFLDMHHRGDSICTAELRRLAALASYVSCVIKFFAIHQNMGPAQWGNTCWQKLTSQSYTN